MTRTSKLIYSIIETLDNNRCKSAQVKTTSVDDDFCIKVINLYPETFKNKVANIIETNYCESVMRVSEGATFLVYKVATREQLHNEVKEEPLFKDLEKFISDNYDCEEVQ